MMNMCRADKYIHRVIFNITALILLCSFYASGQSEKKYLRQGNSKYFKGDFTESEVLYRKAIDRNPVSSDAAFSLGDALYRQGKFEDASGSFFTAAEMRKDNLKKAESLYNLGNSYLKNKKVEESIEAYKNSLRLNPSNMEAKYNLAYAQDMLKQQQQQQKQQMDKKDDQNKKDENQNRDQQQNRQQNEESKQQDQQQQQQQQGISKEDAERILNALANDEKKVQEKVKEAKAVREKVRTLINW